MSPQDTTTASPIARRIRARAFIFLILSLLAGTAAVILVKAYLERARQREAATQVSTKKIAVAAMDIPVATALEAKHIELVPWPEDHVPEGAFDKPDKIIGRAVQSAVVAGEPLLAARLAERKTGTGLGALLRPGKRAMAVKVDQVIGIAGFVHPGDMVDVIATVKPDEETELALGAKVAKVTKVILQNLRVLAVGEQLTTDGRKAIKVKVVTLEVSLDQAERLALATDHGSIQLAMRSRLDTEEVRTHGVTPLGLVSNEEGDELLASAGSAPEPEAKKTERSRRRHARRPSEEPPEPKKEHTATPVVEILRADRREERKLRTPNF